MKRLLKSWWVRGGVLAAAIAAVWFWGRGTSQPGSGTTFVARRGPLEITVLEGGSIEALESQDVKCEVRGYQGVKILKIVEEGYQVTEEDVRTNKVLVELDSSELRKQITQHDITFESTLATLVDARQSYDIQLNQNLSDIKAAEQKARFARMDLEKFLGHKATKEIIERTGIEEEAPASTNAVGNPAFVGAVTNAPAIATNAPGSDIQQVVALPASKSPAESTSGTNSVPQRREIRIDFAEYADTELLGDGEAKQKVRKFDDDLQVAQREMGLAKATLEGTQRLFDRGFVTKSELDSDGIKVENSRLKVQTAETARSLFRNYEFPKTGEEFLSKYAEAMRELGRARKGAVSKLAQAEAKVKSAEGRYHLEMRQRKDLNDQVEKCMIRAKKPGLVVYGSGNMNRYYYGEEQIREGALVREQQPIITIPDMTKMAVKVRIHESYIKKITKGQKVRITLDAFPDKLLDGEVSKVGLLPDSQNRWMSPDLKVYLTTITINGMQDWLKPGMSAKTEILVKKLADVVYVPVQAVTPAEGKQLCYVANGHGQERREVEIGEFNDEFIEIKNGIREGERVCLRAPVSTDEKDPVAKPEEKPKPAPASQPSEPMRVGSATRTGA
jgi:HlyD family secretion protein